MFLKFEEGKKRVKKPDRVFLLAKSEELDRLHRRALEVLPGLKIKVEPGADFYLSSAPSSEELFSLREKFSVQAKNLEEDLKAQAYFLHTDEGGFSVFAVGPAGLYYGMLGLSEWFQSGGGTGDFFDAPVFARRGFLQDLSRGQVLNQAGWERLVEALSLFRFNWLTFNLEHNFGYEKHPEIPDEDDQFTKSEAKALFALCKEHYIEVVPMQQSFGHCRGILSREKYRHLAFDEKLLWSLDPRKEEVYSLLEELYAEQAECFPGKFFLVGCDEPFDLKKHWKPEMGGDKTFPQIYLEHLLRLYQILSGLKRQMLVWGDIFVEHPELLGEIPEDMLIINWQYGSSRLEDESFYQNKTKAFAESGREFYVATTTWSFSRLFPELRTMEANNRNFLKAAERLGAKGALLTNWGDLGHLQLLGYLALPIGFFGINSWRPSDLTLAELGKELSRFFFNDRTGKVSELYLILDRINELVSPGKKLGSAALCMLLDDLFSAQYLPAQPLKEVSDALLGIIKEVEALTGSLKDLKNPEWLLDLKPIIYALGILFSRFLIQENAVQMFKDESKKEEVLVLFGHLVVYFQHFALALKDRWLVQAKPRGLEENLRRLLRVMEGFQKRMTQLKEGKERTWEQFRDAPEFAEYKFNLLKELGLVGLL